MIDIFQKSLWKQYTVENHVKKFQIYFPVPPIPDRPNAFSILRTFHTENSRSNGGCFGNQTVWIQNRIRAIILSPPDSEFSSGRIIQQHHCPPRAVCIAIWKFSLPYLLLQIFLENRDNTEKKEQSSDILKLGSTKKSAPEMQTFRIWSFLEIQITRTPYHLKRRNLPSTVCHLPKQPWAVFYFPTCSH